MNGKNGEKKWSVSQASSSRDSRRHTQTSWSLRLHGEASCLLSERKGKGVTLGGRMLVAFINFQFVVHKHQAPAQTNPNSRKTSLEIRENLESQEGS